MHEEVKEILTIIENLDLPHPSGPLLSSFVKAAVDPVVAARYVNGKLSLGEVHSMVSDWAYIVDSITENGLPPPPPDAITRRAITRRDVGKCCITGKAGTFWDPLLVVFILPSPFGWATNKNDRISDMLGVFFGPPYRDWWLSYARNPECMSPYLNHWLVRKSAARAFAQGFVRLDRLYPSMTEYKVTHSAIGPEDPVEVDGPYPLLGDHSRSGIEKVDARFVGTHVRFCSNIQFLELAKRVAPENLLQPLELLGSPPVQNSSLSARWQKHLSLYSFLPTRIFSLSHFLPTSTFLSIWVMFPNKLRIATYEMLRRIGERLYGRLNNFSTVQRLPFGLYLKYQGEPAGYRNELNALQTVRRHTTIPVPRPLDLVVKKSDTDGPFSSDAYLLITRIPGIPLWLCQHVLSDSDCEPSPR